MAQISDEPDPEMFRTIMSQVFVGGTIKVTGVRRHPAADALLVDNVDVTGKAITDIGASDGSASLELIDRLPRFASFTIADRHLTITAVPVGRRWVFSTATVSV